MRADNELLLPARGPDGLSCGAQRLLIEKINCVYLRLVWVVLGDDLCRITRFQSEEIDIRYGQTRLRSQMSGQVESMVDLLALPGLGEVDPELRADPGWGRDGTAR